MPEPSPNPSDEAAKIHPVVEFFHKEWRVIKSLAFWIAVGIAAIGIFSLEERHYGGIITEMGATINQKDATITTVEAARDSAKADNDRLSRDNQQLRTYRGKDTPPLKQNALILARQIHEYIKDWKDTDDPNVKMMNVQKYMQRFSLRASIMRDALDQNGQHSEDFDNVMYGFDYSYKDVRIIADQIEKLANNLPDQP